MPFPKTILCHRVWLYGAVLLCWVVLAVTARGPGIRLSFEGFAIDRPARAIVKLENNTFASVQYFGRSARLPEYNLMYLTPKGWQMKPRWTCGLGIEEFTLAPKASILFEARVDTDTACKLAVYCGPF